MMWDFETGKALRLVGKTLPFVVFRLVVYLAVAVGYLLAAGVGAGLGFGIGSIFRNGGGGAFFGGLIGFGIVAAVFYWLREYILYMVKAGHIAVLVELLDGGEVPDGRGQIDYAQAKVRERFAQASILFGLDQLIKGVLRAVNRALFTIGSLLPIPGLQPVVRVAGRVVQVSVTYTDELIIAHNFRTRAGNPWAASRDALVLYAQNYKGMLKNALFLMLAMYGLTFLIFLVFLAPAAGFLALFPGQAAGWGVAIALLFAWALKAAIIEPFALTAMMQVYFRRIEGQTPNAEWSEKLSSLSAKFREIKDKALGGGRTPGPVPDPSVS